MRTVVYVYAVAALWHLAFIGYAFMDWRRRFGENPPLIAYLLPLVFAPVFAALAYGVYTGSIK